MFNIGLLGLQINEPTAGIGGWIRRAVKRISTFDRVAQHDVRYGCDSPEALPASVALLQ
jgi:hypothetical protein